MATAARRRVSQKLEFWPLTAQRWSDLETLFGERGACGGCWCMWWRLTRAEFEKRKGAQNKRAMKRIVNCGEVPGLLAYADGEPIGWCAVGPREWYPVLQRSRVLKPVDDQPVWAVTCFFIAKPYRGKGISVKLLKAAVALAKKNGARIVEGYPVEPKKGRMPDAFAWTGLAAAFRKAGFVEVLRRSETRPIMRYVVKGTRRARRWVHATVSGSPGRGIPPRPWKGRARTAFYVHHGGRTLHAWTANATLPA